MILALSPSTESIVQTSSIVSTTFDAEGPPSTSILVSFFSDQVYRSDFPFSNFHLGASAWAAPESETTIPIVAASATNRPV